MATKCPKCQTENPDSLKFCGECGTQLNPSAGPLASKTMTLETPAEGLTRGILFAGRYEIIEELGTGGMGSVYRAEDTKIRQEVALKLIRPEIAASRRTIERFRNEIKTARMIAHRNVCRMFDLGEEKGAYFITMEYVSGEDMKSFLRRAAPLSPGRAISIGKQICEGLAEAHRLGIVHRDLKPGNIMIDKDGNARIMDFGIARSIAEKGITGTGVMIGTPEYMSPEQAEGKEADQRSDLYSLGVILFEMVTARLPFEGETALSIAQKHRYEPASDPRMLNPHVPEDLAALILRCLEKDKEARYQTASEVLADLEKIEQQLPSTDRVTSTKRPFTSKEITVRLTLRRRTIAVASFVAVLFVLAAIIWKALPNKTIESPLAFEHSMAVLPFANLSLDQNSEYLADGISDALINALSQIQGFRVLGRTSSFTFKSNKQDVREIGQKLNVKMVLDGSIQVIGQRLRIAAQLISTEDGFQIWSEKFDRNMEDIFAIQDEIARVVVETLKVEILGDKKAPLVKAGTSNLEAYNLYLQGKYFLRRRGREDLLRSVDYFWKALAIDQKYAPAYVGLSNTYFLLGENLVFSPEETYPKAKAFALRALEIDDKLAEAISALAVIKFFYEWDFAGAERDFKKVIEISQSSGHVTYAFLLASVGRHDEAISEMKLARDLDPLVPRYWANVGFILYLSRKYDEALQELNKALEFDSSHAMTYKYLGDVYREMRRYDESVTCFKKAIEIENHPYFSVKLAITYARAGQIAEARKLLGELHERAKKEYVSSIMLSPVYGALGDIDVAFELLDKAYAERDARLIYLQTEPIYDSIRHDPRFATLLKRIGLDK